MVLVAEPLGAAPGSIEPGLRACTVVGGAVAAQTGNRRHVLVAAGVRRCVPAVEPGRVVAELGEPRLDARDLWGASVDARPRSKKGVLWASSLDARRGGSTQLKTQSTSSPAVATADAFRSSPASPNHAAMAARPGRPRKALRAAACALGARRATSNSRNNVLRQSSRFTFASKRFKDAAKTVSSRASVSTSPPCVRKRQNRRRTDSKADRGSRTSTM